VHDSGTAQRKEACDCRKDRVVGWMIFLSLFITFLYFNQPNQRAGWNVNSRLALTYALVEQKTPQIDDYHASPLTITNDKAFFEGHYYCDKSPLLSIAGVPAYAGLWVAKHHGGLFRAMPQARWVFWSRYAIRTSTVSISAAFLGLLLFYCARNFGAAPFVAAMLSVSILLGTTLSGYATLFFPYLPASLCSVGAYMLLYSGRLKGSDRRRNPLIMFGPRLFFAGLLTGLAWFFDFTMGLLGIGLAAYALMSVYTHPRAMWKFVLGGLIPVSMMALYSYSIFGEVSIPYKYEYDTFFREQMQQGFQGIHLPRPAVFYFLTLHPFKGIFLISPFLLLWLVTFWSMPLKRRAYRFLPDIVLSVYVVVAYLVFNCGYYMWWGGWATGARLFNPALPFFLPPLAIWLARGSSGKLLTFSILLGISIAFQSMTVAVDPQCPPGISSEQLLHVGFRDSLGSPLFQRIAPAFLSGELAPNLGNIFFKLPGLLSLLPLIVLWCAVWIFLSRYCKTYER